MLRGSLKVPWNLVLSDDRAAAEVHEYMCVYIYIYIERERERDRYVAIYI